MKEYTLELESLYSDMKDVYFKICEVCKDASLDDLIREYGLEAIELFILDVECAEYSILKDYSWGIKPKYMHIEYHFYYDDKRNIRHVDREMIKQCIAMDRFIQSLGYKPKVGSAPKDTEIESVTTFNTHIFYVRSESSKMDTSTTSKNEQVI